jgi:hypothetical protein
LIAIVESKEPKNDELWAEINASNNRFCELVSKLVHVLTQPKADALIAQVKKQAPAEQKQNVVA